MNTLNEYIENKMICCDNENTDYIWCNKHQIFECEKCRCESGLK